MGKLQGDLLVIRSKFEIKRREFLDKVSNEIDLSLSIAGAAAKGAGRPRTASSMPSPK